MHRDHAGKETIMDHRGTPNLVHLTAADARILRVPHARGQRIASLCGAVWITEEGRPEDIILRAGESVTLQGPGTALVMALGSADVEVIPAPALEDRSARWQDAVDHFEDYDRAARRLRAEAFRNVLVALACEVRGLGRRIAAAFGVSVAPQRPCGGTA
jgi:hypothetical protein